MTKLSANKPSDDAETYLASAFHERLMRWIDKFDAGLSDQFEVGVRLVNFGETIVFRLENLGHSNPSLILFSGKAANDDPVELIQHVSQISILLIKIPRRDPSQPKRRIGFHSTLDPKEVSSFFGKTAGFWPSSGSGSSEDPDVSAQGREGH